MIMYSSGIKNTTTVVSCTRTSRPTLALVPQQTQAYKPSTHRLLDHVVICLKRTVRPFNPQPTQKTSCPSNDGLINVGLRRCHNLKTIMGKYQH